MDSWPKRRVHNERLIKILKENGYPAYTIIRIDTGLFRHFLEALRACRKKKMGRLDTYLQLMGMAQDIWQTLVVDPTLFSSRCKSVNAHYHEC